MCFHHGNNPGVASGDPYILFQSALVAPFKADLGEEIDGRAVDCGVVCCRCCAVGEGLRY